MSPPENRPDRSLAAITGGEFHELPDLPSAVLDLIGQVPEGRVSTYGLLARALGDPVAARWIGSYLLDHPHDDQCPCHRIVRADGEPGRFIENNESRKRTRLRREGCLLPNGLADLSRQWTAFESQFPLRHLADWQTQIAASARLQPLGERPRLVGGVDTSYDQDGFGVAAMAIIDLASNDLVWSMTCRRPVRFPYITGYLAFRELPLLLELYERVREQERVPDVILVDGSGLLHPRHCGVATMLGVLTDHPTVGLTKKLLCGSYSQQLLSQTGVATIQHDGSIAGAALLPKSGSRKPLFASPAHRIDVATATTLVQQSLQARRLPEPIYWADRISRQAASPN